MPAMLKKSFISIFFTSKKLQVMKLNSQKNTVETFAAFDIPDKLIIDCKIQDKTMMVNLLADIWNKLGLEEKSVGIILPEFSTFSKSIQLPKLSIKELDEAARWKFRDFWPSEGNKMIMDWKIVKETKDNYEILIVSITKDILMGFVDAAGNAGLFPLVVETPSLSLVRISDGNSSGKLVIYINFNEVILTLAKGKEILGSSVLGSLDPNNIVWTAQQMLKHYKTVQIKRIEIGGLQISQELIDNLSQTLKLPINWIQKDIIGLSVQQVQEYLIPLSLQFKDPAEPINETTINLLPLKWVNHYQGKKLKLQIWGLMLGCSITIWLCLLSVLGVFFFLDSQVKKYQQIDASQNLVLPSDVNEQIQNANQTAAKVLKITDIAKSPQEVISWISKAKVFGIKIDEYDLDFDTGKGLVRGIAENRQALIDFKQNFEENENLTKAAIPIQILEKEKNLEFEVVFNFLPSSSKRIIKIPIK